MSAARLPSKSFVEATCQPAPGFGRFSWLEPENGLTLLPLLCQRARSPLSLTHKRSAAPLGLLPAIIGFAVLSKSAMAAMCQVGPMKGRLKPFGEVARRFPLPSSSQIALSPESLNRRRSPRDPIRPPARFVKSPLKFPRLKSVIVVMASPPPRLHAHQRVFHGFRPVIRRLA